MRERKMLTFWNRAELIWVALVLTVMVSPGASAQKRYDIGASDTEIKVGNIMPYSGPASAYGVIGRTEQAYFNKLNAEGGIHGRKISFISYDDAYSPPKTFEQVRRLVESDEVLLIFQSLGTPSNTAIQRYMNAKKVPQVFVATGATKWNDPEHFPCLGDKAASMIVAEESYELSEPTIESQIGKLKASGADVLVNISTPKFAAQAIRKIAEIGWKPTHYLANVSLSVGSVIKPAGVENAQGIISSAYLKDPTDPQWKDDAGIKEFFAFLDKYYPDANRSDAALVYGYTVAQTLEQVLKQCGDDLTRDNVMKQAASLNDLGLGGLLPGIKINTSASDFAPIEQLQLERFEGDTWHRFGDVIGGELGG